MLQKIKCSRSRCASSQAPRPMPSREQANDLGLVVDQPFPVTTLTKNHKKIGCAYAEVARVVGLKLGFQSGPKSGPIALGKKISQYKQEDMADREGFEPSVRFHVHTRSRRAPSTTRPPVRSEPSWAVVASAANHAGFRARIYTELSPHINPAAELFSACPRELRSDLRAIGDTPVENLRPAGHCRHGETLKLLSRRAI